jgi:hypothetical protein
MPGIMSDNDVKGFFRVLMSICNSDPWRDIWQELQFDVFSFEDFGLAEDATDAQVWRVCQAESVVLITGNRNADDSESLEVTIREHNNDRCLPVLTLADADRVGRDRVYAEMVVERLLETLMDLDVVRGAGRLYMP